jgi:hypothetical protein
MDRTKLLCCMRALPGTLLFTVALNFSGTTASAHELSLQEC